MKVTVFYSWQSDSEWNKRAILNALLQVKMDLEGEIDDLVINIDEATSNEVGALHIPNSILRNISNSDIFVGDISIVGSAFGGSTQKKLSNPNVLIELGYALAELSWNRIILVFNKSTGEFPKDLPFDIEKRSCVDFLVKEKDDKNGVGQLRVDLKKRISEIIEKNPQKPTRDWSVIDSKRRTQDIKIIEWVLDLLRVKRMDQLFRDGYRRIDRRTPWKIKKLSEHMTSKEFHVFDEELKMRLGEFERKLSAIHDLLKEYRQTDYKSGYENRQLSVKAIRPDPTRFDGVKAIIKEMEDAYDKLTTYVRNTYHEIDFDKYTLWEDEE